MVIAMFNGTICFDFEHVYQYKTNSHYIILFNFRETLCTVKVNVKDINDNAPYFSKTDYETSVNEAANLNTIVFALQVIIIIFYF